MKLLRLSETQDLQAAQNARQRACDYWRKQEAKQYERCCCKRVHLSLGSYSVHMFERVLLNRIPASALGLACKQILMRFYQRTRAAAIAAMARNKGCAAAPPRIVFQFDSGTSANRLYSVVGWRMRMGRYQSAPILGRSEHRVCGRARCH